MRGMRRRIRDRLRCSLVERIGDYYSVWIVGEVDDPAFCEQVTALIRRGWQGRRYDPLTTKTVTLCDEDGPSEFYRRCALQLVMPVALYEAQEIAGRG